METDGQKVEWETSDNEHTVVFHVAPQSCQKLIVKVCDLTFKVNSTPFMGHQPGKVMLERWHVDGKTDDWTGLPYYEVTLVFVVKQFGHDPKLLLPGRRKPRRAPLYTRADLRWIYPKRFRPLAQA